MKTQDWKMGLKVKSDFLTKNTDKYFQTESMDQIIFNTILSKIVLKYI